MENIHQTFAGFLDHFYMTSAGFHAHSGSPNHELHRNDLPSSTSSDAHTPLRTEIGTTPAFCTPGDLTCPVHRACLHHACPYVLYQRPTFRQFTSADESNTQARTTTAAGQAGDEALRAQHHQVVKETVLAFTVIRARRDVIKMLESREEQASLGDWETELACSAVTKSITAQAEAEEEQFSHLLSLVPAGELGAEAFLSRVPHTPVHLWAGAYQYNTCVGVDDAKERRRAPFNIHPCWMPRQAFIRELRSYWKLHEAAEARARLHALRNNDAAAFAEHVSLLKVSTLLQIMQRTDDFMRRIGMALKCKSSAEANALTAPPPPARPEAPQSVLNDYQRFKAYVASTKDEYKLTHQIDVFVERQPAGLNATLLPHQLDGLRFLASLHANRINGILADEMGVGKTIQTLAFLLYLKEQQQQQLMHGSSKGPRQSVAAPHLVLAPLSVIREWGEACAVFTPQSLRVALLQDIQHASQCTDFDLLLLPVHAARLLNSSIARVKWGYVIVDEAHKAIANLKTLTAQAILHLRCSRRLVLTGTPLNSDLRELWSLLFFLNPEVFSEQEGFDDVFRRPFATYAAKEMELSEEERGLLVLRLHQTLRPFMLRRTKKDVHRGLQITFHNVRCPLSRVQSDLLALLRTERRLPFVYADDGESGSDTDTDSSSGSSTPSCNSRQGSKDVLAGAGEAAAAPGMVTEGRRDADGACAQDNMRGYGLTSHNVSETCAQLLCNHAFLWPFCSQVLHRHGLDELVSRAKCVEGPGAAEMVLACSGKFLCVLLLLSRAHLAQKKTVIFTHWLDCMDLLAECMTARGWGDQFVVLSGNTSEADRRQCVRRFREDPTCLFFLISIKAGGCGINLQVAHLVLLLDRDYTTANEDQALGRVFRLGQRHTVRAVYFTTADVAEQRVMERAMLKNKPRQAIIEDGNYQVSRADDCKSSRLANESNEEDDRGETSAPSESGEVGCTGAREVSTTLSVDALWDMCTSVRDRRPAGDVSLAGPPSSPPRPRDECFSSEDHHRLFSALVLDDDLWLMLRRLVESIDALVVTESDTDGALQRLLAAHLPPARHAVSPLGCSGRSSPALATTSSAAEGEANITAACTSRNACHWAEFWLLWCEALCGPALLRDAVRGAAENDARANDPATLAANRRRKARRDARRLRLAQVEPPMAFTMGCWEKNLTDHYEIARLYLRQLKARRRAALRRTRAKQLANVPDKQSAVHVNSSDQRVISKSKDGGRHAVPPVSSTAGTLTPQGADSTLFTEQHSTSMSAGAKGKRVQRDVKARTEPTCDPPAAAADVAGSRAGTRLKKCHKVESMRDDHGGKSGAAWSS